MTLSLEHPETPNSVLARCDPRWKLAGIGSAVVSIALLHRIPMVLAALAGAVLLVLVARLPWRWYASRLGALALFLLVFVGALPFVGSTESTVMNLGPVTLSKPGLVLASLILLKTLVVVSLILVLLGTAPLTDTLKAAHSLHVPGLLIQLALLAYRYVFVLGGELGRQRIALRVRGFRSRPSQHTYRTIGHVAGTLLVRGVERAEHVGQAMRCRGFDGHFRTLTEFRTRGADVGLFSLLLTCGLGLLLWDRLVL
jgi:cobalt/nickel transport system permease protein